ncbi:hypothetical protein KIL84_012085 [Mauremys mutica]|uniref:Uncharacterized protein n=1 Tax=Mauremys mutica TaxID=74926 RepID=A0A9D3XEF9_9SAUR|nr:hypothetical protein KIL84_012085 [Mauremys mutica]
MFSISPCGIVDPLNSSLVIVDLVIIGWGEGWVIEIALKLCPSARILPTWQVIQDIMKKKKHAESAIRTVGLAYEHMVFSYMQYTLTEPSSCWSTCETKANTSLHSLFIGLDVGRPHFYHQRREGQRVRLTVWQQL